MYLEHLTLSHFRNYEQLDIEFTSEITVLVGSNGMGKTNIVEAIGYLAHLSSHRVAHDMVLVQHQHQQAILRARIQRGHKTALVELEINSHTANRSRINRGSMERQRHILGMITTVLFAPEDLALVKADPAARRQFMDEMLVSIAPRFAAVRSDYDKALKQRNALIKQAKKAKNEGLTLNQEAFHVWNLHTANLAANLLSARLKMIAKLKPYVKEAYEAFTDQSKSIVLKYHSSLEDIDHETSVEVLQQKIIEKMNEKFIPEIERGVSLVGPHRDDLDLVLGDLPAKGYASHGESWSIALALKLACYLLLKEKADIGGEPILILDDVFAELDHQRRTKLGELVQQAEQVIITAAVLEDIPPTVQGNYIKIDRGRISYD